MRSIKMVPSLAFASAALLAPACTDGIPTHAEYHGLGGGDAGAVDSAGTGGSDVGVTTIDGGISTGCGIIPDDPLNKWSAYHMLQVGTRTRAYNVKLPPDYDPALPYRVIFLGPGCGGSYAATFEIDKFDMGQAILVGLNFAPGFEKDCFDDNNVDSFEYPYFDMLHKDVESKFCVDTKHEFYAGYSTGSWLANMLGCKFAGLLRAQGGVSGELPPLPTCAGPIAAMFIHDMMDMGNAYAGSVAASKRILSINKCVGTDTAPYDVGPGAIVPSGSQCVKYTGCPVDYPVVFCTTMGQGHSSQPALAPAALWNFFSGLK